MPGYFLMYLCYFFINYSSLKIRITTPDSRTVGQIACLKQDICIIKNVYWLFSDALDVEELT